MQYTCTTPSIVTHATWVDSTTCSGPPTYLQNQTLPEGCYLDAIEQICVKLSAPVMPSFTVPVAGWSLTINDYGTPTCGGPALLQSSIFNVDQCASFPGGAEPQSVIVACNSTLAVQSLYSGLDCSGVPVDVAVMPIGPNCEAQGTGGRIATCAAASDAKLEVPATATVVTSFLTGPRLNAAA